jgi:hypothetical protein
MEETGCFETSILFHQTTEGRIPGDINRIEDGAIQFLRDVGTFLPDNTVSQPRTQ